MRKLAILFGHKALLMACQTTPPPRPEPVHQSRERE
jgi:hypothetical protein